MSSPIISEKGAEFDVRGTTPSHSDVDVPEAGIDDAWKFLNEHRDAAGVAAINIDSLRLKIDLHIVPLMFLCYTMQFLDKVILNVSRSDMIPFVPAYRPPLTARERVLTGCPHRG
jgi:hypothetical protein